MVGWHHWFSGHEFEQVPGVADGQGDLACCSPWGHKELDTTEQLNWTELTKWSKVSPSKGASGHDAPRNVVPWKGLSFTYQDSWEEWPEHGHEEILDKPQMRCILFKRRTCSLQIGHCHERLKNSSRQKMKESWQINWYLVMYCINIKFIYIDTCIVIT